MDMGLGRLEISTRLNQSQARVTDGRTDGPYPAYYKTRTTRHEMIRYGTARGLDMVLTLTGRERERKEKRDIEKVDLGKSSDWTVPQTQILSYPFRQFFGFWLTDWLID